MSVVNLKREPNESEFSYVTRLGRLKDSGLIDMTWSELADIFNDNCRQDGEKYSESTYRKRYSSYKHFQEEFGNESPDESRLIELQRELEKERVKLRDERNEYRKLIREEARKESYQEQFIRSIEEVAGRQPLKYNSSLKKQIIRGNTTLVVPLTDIHCGMQVYNNWNNYDVDVFRQMLIYYIDIIKEIAIRHGAENVVVLGTELVSGIIHNHLRIQNNQDLIDQFLLSADYVSVFLAQLSYHFNSVKFHVAPGNHGRIMQKSKDSLVHENIENLAVPYIRSKLQNFNNIQCYDNEIDPGIVAITVEGHKLVFVHGDLDTMQNATKNMTKLLGYVPDIIVLGHRHFNALTTDGDTKIIQSGSFVGTDEYALSKRLVGKPEQSPFVVSQNNGLECVYNVQF